MNKINYHNRRFIGIINYDDGDFNSETIFHYRHKGDVVWGTYRGGGVQFGTFIAAVNTDSSLDIRWQYINTKSELKTGICKSIPKILPDGRIQLHESWQFTGDSEERGTSVIEEACSIEIHPP